MAARQKQLDHWLPIDLALDGGSGGGTSYAYTQPTYQAGVVPTKLLRAARLAPPMRVVPDISMDADPRQVRWDLTEGEAPVDSPSPRGASSAT